MEDSPIGQAGSGKVYGVSTATPTAKGASGKEASTPVDLDSIDVTTADKSPINAANGSDGKYSVGSRLEAMDLSTCKWYSVKVVEVDWDEGEVLIHFEKWSQRFDEWIPVDSSRLRPTQQVTDGKVFKFQLGETVMAMWSKRKYPAKVKAILSGDLYEVLFYDGFSKTMKENKLSKCVPGQEVLTLVKPSHGPTAVTMTKAERRERKRKIHSVAELFHTKKKSKESFSPPYVIPDFDEKPKRMKLVKEKKKPRPDSAAWSDEGEKTYINMDSSLTQEESSVNESSTDLDGGRKAAKLAEAQKGKPRRRKRQYQKIALEQAPVPKEVYPFKGRKYNEAIGPDDYDNWEPDGDDAYVVETGEGLRRSIVVQDEKLPSGWSKHTIQRKSGNSAGKWDVFLVSPNGRRFRSRKEMQAYFIEMREEYKPDLYDFTLRGLTKQQICNMKRKSSETEHLKPAGDKKSKQRVKPTAALGSAETEKPQQRRGKAAVQPSSAPAAEAVPARPPLESGKVYVGALEIQMENNAFNCPSAGCAKHFRKENLLQMHIKYYHPELNKYMGSTPNVADLAYARTVGEPFEETPLGAAVLDKMKRARQRALSPQPAAALPEERKRQEAGKKASKNPPEMPSADAPLSTSSPVGLDHFKAPASTPLRDLLREQPKAGVTAGIKTLLPIVRTTTKIREPQSVQEAQKEAVDVKSRPRKRQLSGAYMEQWKRKKSVKHAVQVPVETSSDEAKAPNPFLTPAARQSFNKKKMPLLSASLSKPPVHVQTEPLPSPVALKVTSAAVTRTSGEDQRNKVDIINCTCGVIEEDGLMIQCDLCLCWQHGLCHSIEHESQVPEKYVCSICLNPARERKSQKHVHDQAWVKEGVLPSLTGHPRNFSRVTKLKRSHELTASLLDIGHVVNSLRVKVNIANTADHPKLYLWAKPWDKEMFDEPVKKERVTIKVEQTLTPAGGDNNLNVMAPEMPTSNTPSLLQALTQAPAEFETATPGVALESMGAAADSPSADLSKDTSSIPTTATDAVDPTNTPVSDSSNPSDPTNHSLDPPNPPDPPNPVSEPPSSSLDPAFASVLSDDPFVGTTKSLALGSAEMVTEMMSSQLLQFPICPSELIRFANSMADLSDLKATVPPPAPPPPPAAPEPEKPIDLAECRLLLLEHIEQHQQQVKAKLDQLEEQIAALEAEDPEPIADETTEFFPQTKQTYKMLLRDLATVCNIAAIN